MTTQYPLGVCTWTFGDMPLAEIAQRLAALNYNGVELMGNLAAYRPAEAARILQDHNLQIFSLTPDNVDLAHPNDAIRAKAVDYYLRLLDFAAELGRPLVSCHGYVGRVRAVSSQAREHALFVEAVRRIAERAAELNLRLVMELLNRYEAHLLNTATQALDFIKAVNAANVGILLDAYHMNIEEPDPAAAIKQAGSRLWLYHVADSNRQAVGNGHINFTAQLDALAEIGYQGPIILECTAPGPDPFTAIKDEHSLNRLEAYLRQSQQRLRGAGRM